MKFRELKIGDYFTCVDKEDREGIAVEAWDLFLKQGRRCNLSNQPIYFGHRDRITASPDRIDNNKGYVASNMQWLHKDVNMMKYKYDQDYFIFVCGLVDKYNKEN